MSADSEDRRVIRIAISPAAKKAVEKFAEDFDMKEVGVASRMYEWFGRQPEEIQLWVLGIIKGRESAGMRAFAQDVLGAATDKPAPALPEHSPIAHVAKGQNATKSVHDAAYGPQKLRGEGEHRPDEKKRGR